MSVRVGERRGVMGRLTEQQVEAHRPVCRQWLKVEVLPILAENVSVLQ